MQIITKAPVRQYYPSEPTKRTYNTFDVKQLFCASMIICVAIMLLPVPPILHKDHTANIQLRDIP